jgi:serine/threonine protein kinase/tetratricopeptide (TPR) repeat protein
MALDPGTLLGPYEIVELRGKGGMGEVYRARDRRLGRDVAVKVLSASLSNDPTFKHRFEREARAVSRLQHPHICALYDVGSQGGVEYLVMEYLEGQSLEERLRRGSLPIEDVVRIGSEIAEAVEAAHRKGVVHRDLKPGNVILTTTGAKVVDFGVAREIAPAGGVDPAAATLAAPITEEGRLTGTLLYMAPEQLDGRAATPRSDIWALGCVLYEMATSERPFRGDGRSSLIAAIAAARVEPLRSARPDAPERLEWVVRRCLERDPERRWQDARDVKIALESIGESDSQPVATTSFEPATASFPSDRRGRRWARSWLSLLGMMVLLAAIGVLWRWWPFKGTEVASPTIAPLAFNQTVAVLPFENMTENSSLDQVARGLPEELILRLGPIWPVVDRNRSFPHAGEDPCAAARALESRFVLDGSVRAAADRVRVSAQLFGCPERLPLWTNSYDREGADLLALQADVAATTVAEMQQALWAHFTDPRIPGSPYFYLSRFTKDDNERALGQVREALAVVPNVWTWNAYANVHTQRLREGWWDSPDEIIRELDRAARGVCESQRGGWLCHANTALAAFWGGSPDEVLPALELSVETSKGLPVAHSLFGMFQAVMGEPEAGLASIERAIAMSPTDASMSSMLQQKAWALFAGGDYDGAQDAALRSTRLPQDVNLPHTESYLYRAASLAHLGRLDEARVALNEARKRRPALRLEVVSVFLGATDRDFGERYLEGLRMAGLTE